MTSIVVVGHWVPTSLPSSPSPRRYCHVINPTIVLGSRLAPAVASSPPPPSPRLYPRRRPRPRRHITPSTPPPACPQCPYTRFQRPHHACALSSNTSALVLNLNTLNARARNMDALTTLTRDCSPVTGAFVVSNAHTTNAHTPVASSLTSLPAPTSTSVSPTSTPHCASSPPHVPNTRNIHIPPALNDRAPVASTLVPTTRVLPSRSILVPVVLQHAHITLDIHARNTDSLVTLLRHRSPATQTSLSSPTPPTPSHSTPVFPVPLVLTLRPDTNTLLRSTPAPPTRTPLSVPTPSFPPQCPPPCRFNLCHLITLNSCAPQHRLCHHSQQPPLAQYPHARRAQQLHPKHVRIYYVIPRVPITLTDRTHIALSVPHRFNTHTIMLASLSTTAPPLPLPATALSTHV
ncbi:hypothetical protein OF83DRAFT_1179899 [Amylostereum chailletii]|nr:hypothetical protein OF83DRAFT_1179899 [Amylostereum chailletii]